MLVRKGLLVLLFIPCFDAPLAFGQELAKDIYLKMMSAMVKVKTATFTIELQERIYGKMHSGIHHVKLQASKPLCIYLKSVKPDAGAEVLYIEGANDNKALVHPNSFPFINLNLSPDNPLLRKHHHYTIRQMGFAHAHSIMRYYENAEKDRFYSKLKVTSEPNYYILEIDNDEFGFINYKVNKGENITSIAKKFHVNDQMILELNRKISGFNDVSAGTVLTIPNTFAKRIVMHVDKKSMLPIRQFIYDLKGLYSQVEFKSLRVNPALTEEDFSKDNPQYGF
jgi:hypothetical protein